MHQSMGAMEFNYFSKDEYLSTDEKHPNIFESTASYEFKRGGPAYDMFTQQQSIMPVDGRMTTNAEAIGYVRGREFIGRFFGGALIEYHVQGAPQIRAECAGSVKLSLVI